MNNLKKNPLIGFGTWRINKIEEAEVALRTAIASGYELIDTANGYGNEEIIGLAFHNALKENRISRKEILVAGKVWNKDRGYENTIRALHKTLKNLSLDYLDFYLVHWPASNSMYSNAKEINISTWKAMEKLKEEGLVKEIGVCNYLPSNFLELENTANIIPAINQIEYHPGCMQREIVEFCNSRNIQIEAWSPLGRGKVVKKDILRDMALKYNKSVAQICIRWAIQNNVIPIPKSVSIDRIKENINVFDFKLLNEDMSFINQLPDMCQSGLNTETISLLE